MFRSRATCALVSNIFTTQYKKVHFFFSFICTFPLSVVKNILRVQRSVVRVTPVKEFTKLVNSVIANSAYQLFQRPNVYCKRNSKYQQHITYRSSSYSRLESRRHGSFGNSTRRRAGAKSGHLSSIQ